MRCRIIAAVAAALLSGCGASSESNTAAVTPTPRDCSGLGFPYPTPDAKVTDTDGRKTVHVPLGGLVEVDLYGSPSRRWSRITLEGNSVVSLSTQAMTPTVGTRLGEYCAVERGNTSLAATDGATQWSATIVVP